jgi:DNA polymerase-3 subunit beta
MTMTTATATRKKRSTGVTLATGILRQAITDVSPAVSARPAKAILQNVLLADGRLTATDLEIQISAEIDYHDEPLLLSHARLKSILATAIGPEVSLTVDGSVCVVSVGRGVWRLPMESAAEFPAWTADGVRSLVRLPGDQFARAVRGTCYATDTESSRFALGAVLVEVARASGTASFVATDGRRLSLVECEHGQDVDDGTALVPSRALAAMAALAGRSGDDEVQLEASARELSATLPGATVLARLVDGRFPRWRDVLGGDRAGEQVTVVNREELLSATRAAAIVTTEQSKGVEFAFSPDGIWLHGQSSDAGESSVTIDVVSGPGKAVTVKLDPRFVADWLRGLSSEDDPNVTIGVIDPGSAAIFRCDSCTGVVMPLSAD